MRYYYNETGRVRSLGTYLYVGVRNGKKRALTFVADDRTTADRYALRWCRLRGYKCYKKRRKS